MNRQLLTGALTGAALVSIPTVVAYLLSSSGDQIYLRVAEDSPLDGMAKNRPENGPVGVEIIRACGVSQLEFDNFQNDHTASSFFKVSDASTEQLNCVIGEARSRHLGVAFSNGINTSEFYKLPGDPVAYTRCESAALIAGTCQLKSR